MEGIIDESILQGYCRRAEVAMTVGRMIDEDLTRVRRSAILRHRPK